VNDKEADLDVLAFDPALVREVWKLQDGGAISSTAAKEVLAELIRSGEAPQKIVERKGLSQVSDAFELEAVVDAVIARNPAEVEKYKGGKANLLGFFVGQAMKDLKARGSRRPHACSRRSSAGSRLPCYRAGACAQRLPLPSCSPPASPRPRRSGT